MPQVVASLLPEPSAPFAARSTTPSACAEAFVSASKFTTYNNSKYYLNTYMQIIFIFCRGV
jgi:hypothetical protein